MEEERSDLEGAMLGRVRKHMLTSLGGFGLGMGGLAISARLLGHDPEHRGLLAVIVMVCLAVIPVVGLTSTVKNLRCPSCEGLVAFQVSANASLFAGRARKTCRHCDKKIFGDELVRGFRRLAVVVGVGTFALGLLAGVLKMAMR